MFGVSCFSLFVPFLHPFCILLECLGAHYVFYKISLIAYQKKKKKKKKRKKKKEKKKESLI
jgi:predicted membrane protein